MTRYFLTEQDRRVVEDMATLWQRDNAFHDRQDKHNITKDQIDDRRVKLNGLSAELAFSRLTHQRWNAGDLDLGKADVGELHEVRSTPCKAGHLIVHREDKPDHCFVLAVLEFPWVTFPGWMWGREAQQAKYWDKQPNRQRPCFWVPQCDLHQIRG